MEGHRQMFNSSQIRMDGHQGWHPTEQYYFPIAMGASESSSITHPMDNFMVQGGYLPSQCNPAPSSSMYPRSTITFGLPPYPAVAPGLSHGPYLNQSTSGIINIHSTHPFFNIGGQTHAGLDGRPYDQRMDIGRGQLKRKCSGIPLIFDQGSTSRQYDVGSSANICLPVGPWQEQPYTVLHHVHWECPPNFRADGVYIGGEGAMRNVRSRVDLETKLIHSSDQINPIDIWGHAMNPPTEWTHNLVPPAAHGVTLCSDPRYFSYDPNSHNTPTINFNSSFEIGGYRSDVTSNTNLGLQHANSRISQPVRRLRSGYVRRFAPTSRTSSSYLRPGRVASSSGRGRQMVAEGYPRRHQHSSSNLRLRNVSRNGRNLVLGGRHRFYHEEGSTLGGPMVVADSASDDESSDLLDQHEDMRLDIDSMSYEELLALGERIGSVSTGLSDGSICTCLNESTYHLSQEEGTCVICMEEYKNMDNVGTLKACKHAFHVGCIRKWLSIKNSCPICKAEAYATDDKSLEK